MYLLFSFYIRYFFVLAKVDPNQTDRGKVSRDRTQIFFATGIEIGDHLARIPEMQIWPSRRLFFPVAQRVFFAGETDLAPLSATLGSAVCRWHQRDGVR